MKKKSVSFYLPEYIVEEFEKASINRSKYVEKLLRDAFKRSKR